MFKKIINGIWTFSLKKGWTFLLNQTTVDEKIEETVEEVGRRVSNVREEMKDVGKAVKETINQIDDIGKAVKGKKRRGRPPKNKK